MSKGKQLLVGARVFRHDGDVHAPPVCDVLIEGERILDVGDRQTMGAAASDAELMDLSGFLLLPGLVNAHYHSHDVLAKGFFDSAPLEQWLLVSGPIANGRSLEEVRLRTLVGAVECLRNGVTTVQDFCSLTPFEDRYVDAVLDAYREAGLRVVCSLTLRDLPNLQSIPWAEEFLSSELRKAAGEQGADPDLLLDFAERQIDRIGTRGGMVNWAISPSAPQRCSPRLLRQAADLAARRRLPVYIHVYETRAQRMFAADHYKKYGGSLIAFMESVGLAAPNVSIAHGVWPDPDEIESLARAGVGVVLNMLSNLRLRSGVAPIAAYRRLGVNLALGCDNCSCSDVQSIFQVMKLYCLLGGLMEPDCEAPAAAEALRLATLGGARSAGLAGEFGAIEPQMLADLVAIDLADPAYRPLNSVARQVVFSETGRAVRHVWVNGRLVVRDGRSTTVDEGRLLAGLEELMPAVRRDLARLRDETDPLRAAFAAVQRRAWERPLRYHRWLERN